VTPMTKDLHKVLFEYLDHHRAISRIDDQLKPWLETGNDAVQRRERLIVWLETIGAGQSGTNSEFLSTTEIAMFMARLGAVGGGNSVLDPACGAGLLLSLAAEEIGASIIHGIEITETVSELARLLNPEPAIILTGNSLKNQFPLAPEYDCIISEPPFGARLCERFIASGSEQVLTDVGDALLSWSASKLSPKGRAVFLLPVTCLSPRGDKLWKSLSEQGIHIQALIHVPSGLLKATKLESYIAVVGPVPREQVFVAQYGADKDLQQQILKNFECHQEGKQPAQGRLVKKNGFLGFKALSASERLRERARRSGLKPVAMKDLVIQFDVLNSASSEIASVNAFYLMLNGRCEAVITPDELLTRAKGKKIARLVLDDNLADARFVVLSMNNEVGRLFLDSVSQASSSLRHVNITELMQGTFYLPDRAVQTQVLDASSKIRTLRAELDEIEANLRSHPAQVLKQAQQLRLVNHEDSFESWLEGIPFPLASILWRFLASSESVKEKNEILLHFFEALAEFWATIYLSAAKSDREFWADHVEGLNATVEKAKLSFDKATFGLWKCVLEFLSKKFRDLFNQDADRCSAMFGTSYRDVLEMLFDRRLLTLLQTTNSIRNNVAHGGISSQREIDLIHDQLKDQIQICRSIMGVTWERYELVQPGECRFSNGVFHYKVKRIMGSRTPFAAAERKTIFVMDDGFLHMLDPEGNRSLKLIPFVRVMPSPKTEANACYFYNRRQPESQKYVSYHFESDSEIEVFFADTQAALEGLRPFK